MTDTQELTGVEKTMREALLAAQRVKEQITELIEVHGWTYNRIGDQLKRSGKTVQDWHRLEHVPGTREREELTVLVKDARATEARKELPEAAHGTQGDLPLPLPSEVTKGDSRALQQAFDVIEAQKVTLDTQQYVLGNLREGNERLVAEVKSLRGLLKKSNEWAEASEKDADASREFADEQAEVCSRCELENVRLKGERDRAQSNMKDLERRLDNQRRIARSADWWQRRAKQLELTIIEHDDLEVPPVPADITAPAMAQDGD